MRRLLGEPRSPGHDIKERCASQPCIVLTKSDSTSAAIPPPPDAQACDLDDLSKGLRNPGRRVKHCGRPVIGIRPRKAYETT